MDDGLFRSTLAKYLTLLEKNTLIDCEKNLLKHRRELQPHIDKLQKRVREERSGDGIGVCPICLQRLIDQEQEEKIPELSILSCGHIFHHKCLAIFRMNNFIVIQKKSDKIPADLSCPMCRTTSCFKHFPIILNMSIMKEYDKIMKS